MAKRRTAQEWSTVVERWQQSGLAAKDFAAAEGLVASTLSWWKWHLAVAERVSKSEPARQKSRPKKLEPMRPAPRKAVRKRSPQKPARKRSPQKPARRVRTRDHAPVRLVELVARGAAATKETPLELVVGDDVVVRIRRGFDTETLRRLLAVFGGEDTARC